MTELRTFYVDDDGLHLLDQRALPNEENWLHIEDWRQAADAIRTLAVRGAPAIGGFAAQAVALHARSLSSTDDLDVSRKELVTVVNELATTRPTAVNLFAALDRLRQVIQRASDGAALVHDVVQEANDVCDEDRAMCDAIAKHGATLFGDDERVLTICHTGALATCGGGTALNVLAEVDSCRQNLSVVALETRPLLQGARLTTWECLKRGLDVTLITDGMSAAAVRDLGITAAIVGADRIAMNGDTANKIGSFTLATVCKQFGIPFYVAAPTSTVDRRAKGIDDIPIEERHADEIRRPRGTQWAPSGVPVWNPAFDVTPADFIDAWITELGVVRGSFAESLHHPR